MMRNFFIVLIVAICFSCKNEQKQVDDVKPTVDPNLVLKESIKTHGDTLVRHATISMTIDDSKFRIYRNGDNYRYSIIKSDALNTYEEVLSNNNGYERLVNGEKIYVEEAIKSKMSSILEDNFFVMNMPFSLGDNYLKKEYLGTTSYNGSTYNIIKFSYKDVEGITTPQKKYMCYFNQDSKELDFVILLSYDNAKFIQILTLENSKKIDGILFKDMSYNTISREYFNSPELYYVFNNKKIIKGASPEMTDIKVTIH